MNKSLTTIIAIVAVLLITPLAHGQWNMKSLKVYYNAGSVGVGTNNPAYTLDIRSAGPRAVFGMAKLTQGRADGVYGRSLSDEGRGVVGYTDSPTGVTYGVYGRTDSDEGRAIYGLAQAESGVNFAIVGKTLSPDGFAGYFYGGRNYFSGRVGLGVSTPTQPLHVVGNIKATGWFGTDIDSPVNLFSNNARAFRAESVASVDERNSVNIIGGHSSNSILDGVIGATIAGGGYEFDDDNFPNTINADYGTIGGGFQNLIDGQQSAIAGGFSNFIGGAASSIGGGEANNVSGNYSTLGGGSKNTIEGNYAVVFGGTMNSADGLASSVAGGAGNAALGDYSFAAGRAATAGHRGSFVWGDSTGAGVASTADNQFTALAAGGIRFFSTSGVDIGVELAPGGNSWSAISDRHLKENITALDHRKIVEKLMTIPITRWNLVTQKESIVHIGPMAQDFYSAFGVGEDDRHISQSDADGVALAAIQGLHMIIQDKDVQIKELLRRVEKLEAHLSTSVTESAAANVADAGAERP